MLSTHFTSEIMPQICFGIPNILPNFQKTVCLWNETHLWTLQLGSEPISQNIYFFSNFTAVKSSSLKISKNSIVYFQENPGNARAIREIICLLKICNDWELFHVVSVSMSFAVAYLKSGWWFSCRRCGCL